MDQEDISMTSGNPNPDLETTETVEDEQATGDRLVEEAENGDKPLEHVATDNKTDEEAIVGDKTTEETAAGGNEIAGEGETGAKTAAETEIDDKTAEETEAGDKTAEVSDKLAKDAETGDEIAQDEATDDKVNEGATTEDTDQKIDESLEEVTSKKSKESHVADTDQSEGQQGELESSDDNRAAVKNESRDSDTGSKLEVVQMEYDEESVEEEEQYEEEVEDEEGNINWMLKTRTIRKKRRVVKPTVEVHEEEVEDDMEEVEEEEVEEDEHGVPRVVRRRRVRDSGASGETVDSEEDEVEPNTRSRRQLRKSKKSIAVDEEVYAPDDLDEMEMVLDDKLSQPSAVDVTESAEREEDELRIVRDKLTAMTEQLREMKFANSFLRRKMMNYFKKKKIDNALSQTQSTAEEHSRYLRKMYQYDWMVQAMIEEKEELQARWGNLTKQNALDRGVLDAAVEDLYQRQRHISTILVDPKTGRAVPEKVVEELILQQMHVSEMMAQARLRYIKLKNSVANKQAEVKLDHMGADFHLMDYEQLCINKEEYSDKIISRDLELKEVRQKAIDMKDSNDNMKTRSDKVLSKIEVEESNIEQLDKLLIEARENLNFLKEKRFNTTEDTVKMKLTSGLLTHPSLLHDFEDTKQALAVATQQFRTLQDTFKNQQNHNQQLHMMVKRGCGQSVCTSWSNKQ